MSHIPAERCLSVIELLAEDAGEMPLGEIAACLRLPKSGAHRLLATLVEQGWVEQEGATGSYRLTMRLAVIGQRYFSATGIPDICQPLLDRLAKDTREFVRLAVVETHSLVWVADAQGATGGLMYQPMLATNAVPLFATASGKAWLARLSPDKAADLIHRNGGFEGIERFGQHVIATMEALLPELEATRRRGYGIAVSEAEPGVSALAAAITSGGSGRVVGTVSVAGPGLRMTDQRLRELAPRVIAAASELSVLWPLRRQSKQGEGARREMA